MTTRYTVSRRINAEPEKVWALLADASTYRQWNRAVVSIEGRIAAGETVALVSIANPRRSFRLLVTELTAPTRMVWRDGMPLGLFTGERTYLVEPRAGVTHFEMTEEYTGVLAGVFTKAIPDLTESFNVFADSLKVAAEAPAPA